MLDNNTFRTVVNSTPLVSIDFIITKNEKALLGRRVNKPASNYFFSIGGRVYKNETIESAMKRIIKDEVHLDLNIKPKFIGIFEHFYEDSIFENVSTHYVNLAYKFEAKDNLDLPMNQHSEYKWISIEDLLKSNEVHDYVKNYFRN